MRMKDARKEQEEKAPLPVELADQQALVDALAAALVQASAARQDGSWSAAQNAHQDEGKTIDLIELFYHVISKIIYVIVAAALGALIFGANTEKGVPIYTATAKLFAVGSQGASVNISNLQLGSMLSPDYLEVFKTWEVHEMVRQKLNLNMSYGAMQGMLTVSRPEDTRIIYISVRSADPQLAKDMANAYAEAGKEFILKTMDAEEPNTFSTALLPTSGVMMTTTSRVLIGFLLGMVASLGIIVVRFLLDDRPRTPEDIDRVAGLPTLAVIPAANKRSRLNLLKGKGKKHYYAED